MNLERRDDDERWDIYIARLCDLSCKHWLGVVVSWFLATVGHRRQTRQLRENFINRPYSRAELVAGLISLFGLAVLIATIVRT